MTKKVITHVDFGLSDGKNIILTICVPYAVSKLRSAICGDTFEM